MAVVDKDKTKISRARAEKLISGTTDLTVLNDAKFIDHPNKHVRAKVKHKIAKLT